MESLSDLQNRLHELENQLNQITIKKATGLNYDYGRAEVYGEEQSVVMYTDPALANYLRSEIASLKQKINNYQAYAQEHSARIEAQKEMTQESTEKYIQGEAVKLYEQAQAKYHEKGLIGKTMMLFAGKKPKKLNEEQIQQQYHGEAEKQFNESIIDAKIQDLNNQIVAYEAMRGKISDAALNSLITAATIEIEELKQQKAELNGTRGSR